jgi:PDZ domain
VSAGLWVRRFAVATACLWGGVGVAAQPDPQRQGDESVAPGRDAEWLERFVPKLDSDDYAEREKASELIGSDEGVSLSLIEKRLTDAARPLTPEQSLRLSEAGLKHFANSQRGAMGVSFALSDNALDGVKVGGAVDGFDSKRVLRPGDVIREMDGVSLALNDQMRSRGLIIALIVSHDPGDEVTLDLLRGGEPVVVRLKLGNYKDLRNANELDLPRLRAAWELRCRRAVGGGAPSEPEAVEAGMSAERWGQIGDPVRRATMRRNAVLRQQNVNAFAPQADPGGDEAGAMLLAGGAARPLLADPPVEFSASERGNRNSAQARNLQQQIQLFSNLLSRDRAKLRDPNVPDGQRRLLLNQIKAYEQQLNQLRTQRRQLGGLEP